MLPAHQHLVDQLPALQPLPACLPEDYLPVLELPEDLNPVTGQHPALVLEWCFLTMNV